MTPDGHDDGVTRRSATKIGAGTAGAVKIGAAAGVGTVAGHSPDESDDENTGNGCHSDGVENKDQEDQATPANRTPPTASRWPGATSRAAGRSAGASIGSTVPRRAPQSDRRRREWRRPDHLRRRLGAAVPADGRD